MLSWYLLCLDDIDTASKMNTNKNTNEKVKVWGNLIYFDLN